MNKACIEHTLSQITQKKAEYKKFANKLNHLKTINYDILLSKLYTYGIHGTPFNGLKATYAIALNL